VVVMLAVPFLGGLRATPGMTAPVLLSALLIHDAVDRSRNFGSIAA
jgi:hypothetical protein